MTPEANAIQDLLADNWPYMAVVGVFAVFVIWLLVFLCDALLERREEEVDGDYEYKRGNGDNQTGGG